MGTETSKLLKPRYNIRYSTTSKSRLPKKTYVSLSLHEQDLFGETEMGFWIVMMRLPAVLQKLSCRCGKKSPKLLFSRNYREDGNLIFTTQLQVTCSCGKNIHHTFETSRKVLKELSQGLNKSKKENSKKFKENIDELGLELLQTLQADLSA